ncbi:hypothetical protein A0256_08800 [Mucilaginibacter sp. PAMC 26640]|nr:hypothetical protein A0256_08800 [Mucilaginibacter sp. PAMC 26640]
MKFYIEIWSAKKAWLDLSIDERTAYMAQLGPAIQQLTAMGVEVVTWASNDVATVNRLGYDFFAIWKFPTDELAKSFEALVTGSGWHNYFDQVNMKGEAGGPADVIAQLVHL